MMITKYVRFTILILRSLLWKNCYPRCPNSKVGRLNNFKFLSCTTTKAI